MTTKTAEKKVTSEIEDIKRSKLWSKHWAVQGLPVIHTAVLNRTKDYDSLQMYVVEVCQEIVGPEKKKYTTGIKCRFFNEKGEMQKDIFNTKELIPRRIVNCGFAFVQEWYDRFNYNGQE